jgi:hypothetical protein
VPRPRPHPAADVSTFAIFPPPGNAAATNRNRISGPPSCTVLDSIPVIDKNDAAVYVSITKTKCPAARHVRLMAPDMLHNDIVTHFLAIKP